MPIPDPMTPEGIRDQVTRGIDQVLESRIAQRFLNADRTRILRAVQYLFQTSDDVCSKASDWYNSHKQRTSSADVIDTKTNMEKKVDYLGQAMMDIALFCELLGRAITDIIRAPDA